MKVTIIVKKFTVEVQVFEGKLLEGINHPIDDYPVVKDVTNMPDLGEAKRDFIDATAKDLATQNCSEENRVLGLTLGTMEKTTMTKLIIHSIKP